MLNRVAELSFSLAYVFLTLVFSHLAYAQDSCRILSNTCTQGPETRIINGIQVYKDCWNFEEKYYCETGGYINTCSGLSSACTTQQDTCLETSPDTGQCVLREKVFTCGEIQTETEADLIDSSYTIVKDEVDLSSCGAYSDNNTCTETGNVCVEGAETRIINGKEIYKSCWAWEKQYTCAADSYSDYCAPLNTICTVKSTVCDSYLGNGDCAVERKTYDCATHQEEKNGIIYVDEQLTIVKDITDESSCNDVRAECTLASKSCIEAAETRVINGLPVYKECWKYSEEYACLSGEELSTCDSINSQTCSEKRNECLLTDKNGTCTSRVITYECKHKTSDSSVISCGDQMFCLGNDCYDTSYQPNNELGLAAAYLGTALKAGTEVEDINNIDIFTGTKSTCTQYPINTVDCCDDSGWANGSVSGCDNEDLKLIEERKNKLTHYVGTYCAKKLSLVNTCIEYKQSYCTYGSMLARLFQEGARPQLGMDWGSPEDPSCSGVTAEQLESVDFTLIDFQEYIDHLEVTSINNDEIQKKVAEKVAGMTQ